MRFPALDGAPDTHTTEQLFDMLRTLGYQEEITTIGKLIRTKLIREWNFFFDCISRCLLNKTTNFDALPSTSLRIGYSLLYSGNFDYGNTILQFIISRRADASGVIGYTRFLQLILTYLCPNDIFDDDELLPVFQISEKAITDHIKRDEKNKFSGPPFLPREVRKFLLRNRPTPTQVPTNPDVDTSVTVPDAKTPEITHLISNPSISSSKQQT